MIVVRIATKEDKTDVLRLLDELLTHVEESQGYGSHEPTERVGSSLFDELIVDDKFKIFVAEEDGNVVGAATLFLYPIIRRGQYRGQLEELVVTKSMRGKGAGSKLLEAVKDYCKNNNILSLRLNSGISLTDAHKFYEAHGGKFTEKMFKFDL
ncbi:MAG TPA: GNAT family N-acetyltransferase [Patescibacteria group bacterium]|nr:GNAT family N-acetyltransferase [Patescibacteria group bacterium]